MSKAKKGCNSGGKNTALYEENVRLRGMLDDKEKTGSALDILYSSKFGKRCSKFNPCNIRQTTVLVVILSLFLAFVIYFMVGIYDLSSTSATELARYTTMAKVRARWIKHMCKVNPNTRTFPDIDYALFGYNILRGYPLAVGHDPGLTRPLFISDYSNVKLTADCRYLLPNGFIIVPDISCVTSFTSNTIQDQHELTQSLSVSAQVEGDGWGAKFSASGEYKRKSSEVGTKEAVYINSEAKCDYYLSMIDEMQPPSLSKSFLIMARSIKSEKDVFELFDYYGTHYLKQVTFGARLVYENKMSKSNFKSLRESSHSVTVSASYSGIVRVEGSMSLSAEENRQAEAFREKVETSTISVGAPPPANGSTTEWASEVKENPVPTKYTMAGIEELFTRRFMEGSGVDYNTIHDLVDQSKAKYCEHLKNNGVVDSCKPIESYTKFHNLRLNGKQFNSIYGDERSCIKSCMEERKCIAINQGGDKCEMFLDGKYSLRNADKITMVLFIDRLNIKDGRLKIMNAALKVQARADYQNYNSVECQKKCNVDRKCILFSSSKASRKCKLYQQLAITEDSIKWSGRGSFIQFSTNKTLN